MSLRSSVGLPWRWLVFLLIGAGGLVVLAAVGILLFLAFGRPSLSISPSATGLFRVSTGGWGTEVKGVTVTSAGQTVAYVHRGGAVVPASALAQNQSVQVTATASAPSWLRWLGGDRVSTSKNLRTPSAAPSSPVVLASDAGSVPVDFGRPVSIVDFQPAGGPSQVLHLREPSDVVDFAVPDTSVAGTFEVSAAPLPWERLAPRRTSITWFLARRGGAPIALASPAPGVTSAPSNGPISLTFAERVAKILGNTHPTITPAVPGSWSQPAPNTLVFTPVGFGFGPNTAVTVGFSRPVSVVGADDAASGTNVATASASTAYRFSIAPGSLLRLQQILAQLHYLPLNFVAGPGVATPTTFASEVPTMTQPLPGTFTWRWASTPASLQAEWTVGTDNELLKGALMAFLSSHGNYDPSVDSQTVPQLLNASLWKELLQAAATDQVDPAPYSYVYVTQTLPETLTVWENGSVVLTSATNTGISDSPTANGTFPIYERFTFNYMSGYNPDGSYYHDPVWWINYFNGGDAVHGFSRGSYGWPQSLGCVELPISTAEVAFNELAIGDLVTVAN